MAGIGACPGSIAPDGEAKAGRRREQVKAPRTPNADLGDRATGGATEIVGQHFGQGGLDVQPVGAGIGNLEPLVHVCALGVAPAAADYEAGQETEERPDSASKF